VTTAVARAIFQENHSRVKGEILELKDTVNTMWINSIRCFGSDARAREVGTEGKLEDSHRQGVGGHEGFDDSVNFMAAT